MSRSSRPRRHVQELPEYRAPRTDLLDAYDDLCRESRQCTDCPVCDGERIEPDDTGSDLGAPVWKTCTRCEGRGYVRAENQ